DAALAGAQVLLQHALERIACGVLRRHQPLRAAVLVGDDDDGAARGALLVEGLEDIEAHYSTFSTNTRIVPPQDSPTFQAASSATPNSSVLGLPLSITSIASVTTAPSTQPPETEPRKLPSASMTRCEPTGRGADPQVCTTVAIATCRPASSQFSAITNGSRASSRAALFSMSVLP